MGHVQVHRLWVASEGSSEGVSSVMILPQIWGPSCLGDVPKGDDQDDVSGACQVPNRPQQGQVRCFQLVGGLDGARRQDGKTAGPAVG